jgi:anthranilate synthase/aminodeoxychorismate synthase-like glutamine amidotransferase
VLLLVDNHDSFTYGLVQLLGSLGCEVAVFASDALTVDEAEALAPERLVIGPGPGTPAQAGISLELVTRFAPRIPVLGVGLGHLVIAQAFGARIARAAIPRPGEAAKIFHDERGLFAGVANPLEGTRYHSLVVERRSLPECLELTARTWEDEVMGLRHREYPVHGLQFHPESILTPLGRDLLGNFVAAPAAAEAAG